MGCASPEPTVTETVTASVIEPEPEPEPISQVIPTVAREVVEPREFRQHSGFLKGYAWKETRAQRLKGTALDPDYRPKAWIKVAPGEMTCTGCGDAFVGDYCSSCGLFDDEGQPMRGAARPALVPTISYLRPGEYTEVR